MQATTISPSAYAVLKHGGLPVATTAILADKLGASVDQLNLNYERNVSRYKEGKHFFLLKGGKLTEFKKECKILYPSNRYLQISSKARSLYLWTERGAYNHTKSLGTDEAWDAYERLVDDYYRLQEAVQVVGSVIANPNLTRREILQMALAAEEMLEAANAKIALDAPKVALAEAITESEALVTVRDLAALLAQSGAAVGERTFYEWLVENKYLEKRSRFSQSRQKVVSCGYWPSEKARALDLFKLIQRTINQGEDEFATFTTKVTGEGEQYFLVSKIDEIKDWAQARKQKKTA